MREDIVESIKTIGKRGFSNGSKTVAEGVIEMIHTAQSANKDAESILEDLITYCDKVINLSNTDLED